MGTQREANEVEATQTANLLNKTESSSHKRPHTRSTPDNRNGSSAKHSRRINHIELNQHIDLNKQIVNNEKVNMSAVKLDRNSLKEEGVVKFQALEDEEATQERDLTLRRRLNYSENHLIEQGSAIDIHHFVAEQHN